MEREDRSLWVILAGIVLFSMWYTLTRRTENALWLVLAAICFLILAYRLYGGFVAARAAVLAEGEIAPDRGRLPATRWVAFAYQFAAIAGVGVLVGPVLAVQFGYLPGYLWILLIGVVVGAVHDLVVLIVSSRRQGAFMPSLVSSEIGPWAGLAAWGLTLLALVAFLAVTASYAADLLAGNVWALYTIAVTVVVAVLASAYEAWLRPGHTGEAIGLGAVIAAAAILVGVSLAAQPIGGGLLASRGVVLVLLGAYAVVSALAPLRAVGRARVAISGLLTLGAVALLATGIAFAAPALREPATTKYVSGGGPLLDGSLFPYLALIVASGVISGLNALASTAVTSRLLGREQDALPVGFGARLAQLLLLVLILVAVSTLYRWDYYAMTATAPLNEIERIAENGQRDWDTLRNVLQADRWRVPGGPTDAAQVDNVRRPAGTTALAASVAWLLRGVPGVKQAWLPNLYRFMFVLQALVLVAVFEAAMHAARVAAEGVAKAASSAPPLAGLAPAPKAAPLTTAAGVLAFALVGLALASKADVLRTYGFLTFVALLLAAVGLGVSFVALRAQSRWAAVLIGLPFVVVTAMSVLIGAVSVRDGLPYISRSNALAQVYRELPRWSPAYPFVNPDRAREVVVQWPPAEQSRMYVEQGQAEVARQLQNRLGLPEANAQALSAAIGRRATALSLWAWLQVILTLLVFLLGLAVVAGRWVRVPLAWPASLSGAWPAFLSGAWPRRSAPSETPTAAPPVSVTPVSPAAPAETKPESSDFEI